MAIDVARGVDEGYTLPAEWYSDPAIFRLEQERIFRRSWQYAGHVGMVERPGDYFTARAGLIPIVVTRDGDERITAFVSERPVLVDTWGPFIFVNPDLEAAPLAETLGALPEIVAASGLDFGVVKFHERVEAEIAANWKIVVENYLECYHCPVAHPSFSSVIDVDPDSYRLERHEWFSSQIGPVRPSALEDGDGRPYDPRGEIRDSHFHFLWPTFTLNIVPGPPNVLPLVFLPVDAERTLYIGDYYFSEDATEEQRRGIIEFGTEVGREDQGLVESVHIGLRSGMVERGRLLLSSEHLIQHFQQLVARALA